MVDPMFLQIYSILVLFPFVLMAAVDLALRYVHLTDDAIDNSIIACKIPLVSLLVSVYLVIPTQPAIANTLVEYRSMVGPPET
mmetsp:Transcript_21102/g.34515  ORF Transcript_21102/g.34515 Transcript_21102/m.34515 type:complete len:83 (-) Transcript_21102:636-884(-)